MSKKLVKTAKQQFEERLKELTLLTSCQGLKDDRLYLCENDHKEMSILRDSNEHGFIEYKYQGSYQSMVDSEEFLYNMVCRFNEIGEPVKYIFDWYASADKDLTPFTVYDIWQCMEYLTQLAFEDLYEEEEEDPYATAKEQAIADIKKYGLNKEFDETNGEYWCGDVDGKFVIIVIYAECEPCRYEFAKSREEVYKDAEFQSSIMKCFSENRGSDEVLELFEWTKSTDKQEPFDLYDIVNAIQLHCGPATCVSYEGKPEVTKHDFKDEMDALRKKMVEHIIQLCEQGMTVNVDSLAKRIALGWEDNSFVYTEDIKDLFVKKTENGEWTFCYTSYSNGRSDEYPFKYLSIETLQMFIEAMQ